MNSKPGLRLGWVSGALLSVLLFWWLRVPLLVQPGVERGWNSDHAIYGLMAIASATPATFRSSSGGGISSAP